MNRRDLIALLGSTAATWPLAARAQQEKRRVAVVMPASRDDQEWQPRIATFVETLSRLGWNDGRNLRLDFRWWPTAPSTRLLRWN
jgi:putative ABC transport system substrate-binding protein